MQKSLRHWWKKSEMTQKRWRDNAMFLDWKNTVKMTILLKIIYRFSAIPIKLSIIFFAELKKKKNKKKTISQSVWKHKRPWIAKAILKKNRAGGISLPDFRQSYSHEDSMVLAQKQKYQPAEQDKKPRDKLTHLWAPCLWQRRQEYTMEKREPLQ